MREPLYRKQALRKIASPEQLNDYIRVTRPSVWIVLAAAVVLLAGVFAWGAYGTLDVVVQEDGLAAGGVVRCAVTDSIARHIKAGSAVTVDRGLPATVASIHGNAVTLSPVDVPDGEVYVFFHVRSLHPIELLLR